MKKKLILLSVLMSVSMLAQATPRTGGDDAYRIDSRPPVSNNIVIEWIDARARGGDAYTKPIKWSSGFKVSHEIPVRTRGDNRVSN